MYEFSPPPAQITLFVQGSQVFQKFVSIINAADRHSQPGQSQCPAARVAISSERSAAVWAVNSRLKAPGSGKDLPCNTADFYQMQGRREEEIM